MVRVVVYVAVIVAAAVLVSDQGLRFLGETSRYVRDVVPELVGGFFAYWLAHAHHAIFAKVMCLARRLRKRPCDESH